MRPDPLAALGLELDDTRLTIELGEGVVLTARRPDTRDWSRAQARIARFLDAGDQLRQASARYLLAPADRVELVDPDNHEGISLYLTACEIAVEVVETVKRGDREVSPELPVFLMLFKRSINCRLFMAQLERGDRELIAPKKDCTPSPAGTSAAGASSAATADSSATAVPAAGSAPPVAPAPRRRSRVKPSAPKP